MNYPIGVSMLKKLLYFLPLIALSISAYPQQANPPASNNPACEVQPVKKTLADWSDFSHYKLDNDALDPPLPGQKRVVFFGSSTIENWGRRYDSVFFPGKTYINRGISGETTPQMLLRFQQDVVNLKPAAVVFLGGTNDVAGNTGPMTIEMTEDNIRVMVAIAKANGIKIILASQLPVKQFPWNKCVSPESELLALNKWESNLAVSQHLGYVDFYGVLAGPDGNFHSGLSLDGVHPNKKAYDIMAPTVQRVIDNILNTP
jgi:lysophospholipase L1-like esterase